MTRRYIGFIGTFKHSAPTERQLIAAEQIIERGVQLRKIDQDYIICAQSISDPGDALLAIIKKWPRWSHIL